MDWHTIHERVSALQQEVAQIREKNREYDARRRHSHMDVAQHNSREARLVQILEELTALTKKPS
jgi:hypothetical protein